MSSQKILEDGKRAYKEGRYLDCTKILEKSANEAHLEIEQDLQAAIYVEYGRALQKLANYEESMKFLNKAKELSAKEKSQLHCDALLELGMLYYEQDLLNEAETNLKDALAVATTLYRPPHKEIAKVNQGLAEVAWKRGDHTQALNLAQDALDMQEETVGQIHEEYAESLETKSLALLHMGRLDEAEAGFRRVFEIRRQCLPPDHAYLATSYSNLAHCLGRQGKDEGVEEMIQRAIEICTKSYGEYSPRTAVVVNNLGGYHLDHGNLIEAAKYFERALELKEKVLGKDSPALLRSLNNLAVVYGMLNRKADAQEMSKRSSALMKSKIASSEQKDIDTMILLADRLSVSKQHAEADAVLSQALDTATKEYGAGSLKAAQVLHHMAAKAQNTGDSDKALDHYRALLKIQKKQLGKKHPKVAETLRGISLSLMMQGLGDVAEILNQQAQAIEFSAGLEDPQIAAMRNVFNRERDKKGAKDPSVIQNMRTLAEMYRLRGQNEKGDELYEEYLQLREEEAGLDNLEFARELAIHAMTKMPFNALSLTTATNHQQNDQNDEADESVYKAVELFKKALAINERHAAQNPGDGKSSDELLQTMQQLASAQVFAKQYDEAESVIRRAIDMVEQSKGKEHWSLAGHLNVLAKILKAKGEGQEANQVIERVSTIPPATPEEQNELLLQITDRMFGSMGRMLQSLTGLAETEGKEELDPLPGFEGLANFGSVGELNASARLGSMGNLDSLLGELGVSSNPGANALGSESGKEPKTLADSIRKRIADEKRARDEEK